MSIPHALVQASAYSDSAEVAWFRECNGPTKNLEDFSDSGPERLWGLDSKLGTALSNSSGQHHAFKRERDEHARLLIKHNKSMTWRHMRYSLFHHFKKD